MHSVWLRFFAFVCAVSFLVVFLACGGDPYRGAILPNGLNGPKPAIDESYALAITPRRVQLTKAYFEAHNRALFEAFPLEDNLEAISFEPRIIVVHYTAIDSLEKTVEYFQPEEIASDRGLVTQSGLLNVGSQFLVDRDGSIYSFYPATVMARHTIGLNHVGIGIENVGSSDLGKEPGIGRIPLTQAQLEANEQLIRYLAGQFPSIQFVIGHHEYRDLENPGHPAFALFQEDIPSYRTEKFDPGKKFMKALRKRLANNKSPVSDHN